MTGAQFACSACQKVVFAASPPGTLVGCPHCATVLQVPGQAAVPVAPSPGTPAGPPKPRAKPLTKVRSPATQAAPAPQAPPAPAAAQAPARPKPVPPAEPVQAQDEGDPFAFDPPASSVIPQPTTSRAPKKPARSPKDTKNQTLLWAGVGGGVGVLVLLTAVLSVVWQPKDVPTNEPEPAAKKPKPAPKPVVAATKPAEPPPKISLAPPPPPPFLKSFDLWQHDLDEAKKVAAPDKKDLFILFGCSDGSDKLRQMGSSVFLNPDFQESLQRDFVLVFIDFPKTAAGKAKVKDPARNNALKERFAVPEVMSPRAVFADGEGRPYRFARFETDTVKEALDFVQICRRIREARDSRFALASQAKGVDQLELAEDALEFLDRSGVTRFYTSILKEWENTAKAVDPGNDRGRYEQFFTARLQAQLLTATTGPEVADCFKQLQDWAAPRRFTSPDRGARLYWVIGVRLASFSDNAGAKKSFQAGLALKPADREVQNRLRRGAQEGQLVLSSGTGFVIAAGGYVMTNRHVVEGEGKVQVRLPGQAEKLPAELVAIDDQRDLALVRITGPKADGFRPLTLSAERPLKIGEEVAALGYPLTTVLGVTLGLSKGPISALPVVGESDTEIGRMVRLDLKVYPGNSGGPLCDAAGNVIGIITAKTNLDGESSFGLAIPPTEIARFLAKQISGFAPPRPAAKPLPWDEIAAKLGPSVVIIEKAF